MAITRQAGFASRDELPEAMARTAAVGDISAAADAMGPGTIIVPMFQPMILDMVRRRGTLGQRIKTEPATGQPSRYFEQTRIVVGQFQDPRALNFNPSNDPTRRERYVTIKALYGAIQFNLFDVELTRQQGQFAMLVSKDVQDTVDGTLKTSDFALWNGNDTDLILQTSLEYVGILNQINRTASIASTARIIDGLKAEVASLMSSTQFDVRPTAIYVNPVLGDLIDQEERLNQRQIPQTMLNTVTGGLTVNALATQAGHLPIIPDPFLPNGITGGSTLESGKTDYKAVILSEALVERHYVTSPEPRVFQLGLEGGLGTRYAVVLFDAVVVKGKANASQHQGIVESGAISYAHSVVTVTR
jgi:hypothetical protein